MEQLIIYMLSAVLQMLTSTYCIYLLALICLIGVLNLFFMLTGRAHRRGAHR